MKIVFVRDGIVEGFANVNAGTSSATPHAGAIAVQQHDTCPADAGWAATQVDGTWTFTPPISYPKLSPVQFKLCFTPQERIAIKTARASDPVLEDAYEVLDDARLDFVDLGLQSVQGLIDYCVGKGLVTAERAEQIKTGLFL